jgi:3-hydroxyacyl-CoA dehydrogenase
MPMINEAIITLPEGVAGGRRLTQGWCWAWLHPMGPLQLADFIA